MISAIKFEVLNLNVMKLNVHVMCVEELRFNCEEWRSKIAADKRLSLLETHWNGRCIGNFVLGSKSITG